MDINTKSEHSGTTIWAVICVALFVAGQTIWPFIAGWNYFGNVVYDAIAILCAVLVILSIVKAVKAVWSNDLSPNGFFFLGFLAAIVAFALPVIWHAGAMNHALQ